jgi:cytochrome P450
MTIPTFDPSEDEFLADPYPTYAALRRDAPLSLMPSGILAVSRYADVTSMLKDPRFGFDIERTTAAPSLEPISMMIGRWMLFRDPPTHTRLRGAVTRAFTLRRVDDMKPRIEASVDALIDRVADQGRMDVIADFARPVPSIVICDMVGIPESDRDPLIDSVLIALRSIDPLPMTRKQTRACNEATELMHDILTRLLAERRRAPQPDLLTALLQVGTGEDGLTDDEIIANVVLLFAAGYETTTNLIGNGLLALHRNQDQLALLQQDPSKIAPAIEELLRYDAPVQIAARRALETVEIHGERIEAGEKIAGLLGSANHDETVYENPGRLDITRAGIRHASFGGGIHYCMGAQLGRAEAEIAFRRLFARLPGLHLPDQDSPKWRDTTTLRGLVSLEARWPN